MRGYQGVLHMARIYPEFVGVPEYCDAIDSDCNHSPFVPIAKLNKASGLLHAAPEQIVDLISDGFFLIDPLGRIVDGAVRQTGVAFVIAPHVAQRERGGKSPEHFDRKDRGTACGFGGASAKRLSLSQAAIAVPSAWKAWKHA